MWELDEYGRPKQNWGMASPMWPEGDQLIDNSVAGNPQPPPPTPPTPQVQTQQQTPQDFLKNYGIGTTGSMADQATETAQNYRPETYQGSNQSGGGERYMPQQFGQEGDVYNPEEGPLTPQQTAETMPTSKDAMQKLINQHMLGPRGGLPQASKEGYDNYVTASREKRAAEKDQLRQQADVNRVQRSARNAETDEAMQRANPGMMGGGGQMSSGNRVQNIGGYTFVKGTWRPQTPEENAKVDLMKANAEYARQRPEIAREGYGVRQTIATENNATRTENTGMRTRTAKEIADANREQKGEQGDDKAKERAAKLARETRRDFDMVLNAIRERDASTAEQVEANTPSRKWNYVPFSSGAKPPDREKFLDNERDRRNPSKFLPAKDTYQSMKERAILLADQLEKMHDAGIDVGLMPDDVIDQMQYLRDSMVK